MAMHTSIKSTALEPPAGTPFRKKILSVYGMVILAVVLFVIFAITQPETFPTLLNFQLLSTSKAPLLILALAVTVPMVTGKIDLSAGYGAGLWQIMVLSWQINGMDFRLAIVLALCGGALIGLFNALLIELAQVDAFIATMATGQVIFAITMWYTEGRQITDSAGDRAMAFDQLTTWSLGPIPGPFIIALVIGVILWGVLQFLPVGRYLYAVGANPRAAELTGIPRRGSIIGAMVASGMLAALAGVLIASRAAGVAQANVGPEFLMPALAAAFLGSTTIKPGRVNAFGTILGVVITTMGISGLQQMFQSKFYLEPLFNGLTLIAALVIASMASRRRLDRADEKHTAIPPPTSGGTDAEKPQPSPDDPPAAVPDDRFVLNAGPTSSDSHPEEDSIPH